MAIRKEDVEWTVSVEQDPAPVRGNALASGDDDLDKKVENEILDRLSHGDVWAWASVIVTGRYKSLEESIHLGACSYEDEEDFRNDVYFEDLQQEVLDSLNEQLKELQQAAGIDVVEDLWVCQDCALFIANGDLPEDNDRAVAVVEAAENTFPGWWVLDRDEDEFSSSPCDCCDDGYAGSRFQAAIVTRRQE